MIYKIRHRLAVTKACEFCGKEEHTHRYWCVPVWKGGQLVQERIRLCHSAARTLGLVGVKRARLFDTERGLLP